MSGKNKHYLPRFFQGYFFNRDTIIFENNNSYIKKDYSFLFLSIPENSLEEELLRKCYLVEQARESYTNKPYKDIIKDPKRNFINTGSYSQLFTDETDMKIDKSEKGKERKALREIENSLQNKKLLFKDKNKVNIFFDACVLLFFRNKTIKNKIDYIIYDILKHEDNENNKNILMNIGIGNSHSYNNADGLSLSKLILDKIINEKLISLNKKNDFKFAQIVNVENELLVLTEKVIFTLDNNNNNNIKEIEGYDFNDLDKICFLVNESFVLILTKDEEKINKIDGKKVNKEIIKLSEEFILSRKKIIPYLEERYLELDSENYIVIKEICNEILKMAREKREQHLTEKEILQELLLIFKEV